MRIQLGVLAACVALGGCNKNSADGPAGKPAAAASGDQAVEPPLRIDGSSTVHPITEAVVASFRAEHQGFDARVSVSGTRAGMRALCAGEVQIANASRPIDEEEAELCRDNGVEYVELPLAFDGVAVVVNPKNTWASTITRAELAKLWSPEAEGAVTTWKDVREGWPDREIHLYGPGTDSGTYDYFTQAIVGKGRSSRSDYVASEDDEVLVDKVAGDELALGYFGLSYFTRHAERLKALGVDDENDRNGKGAVKPSAETVTEGTYQPLSRPIFIYVAAKALERPAVFRFVEHHLAQAAAVSEQVGYIPLPPIAYDLAQNRAAMRKTGSAYGARGARVGLSIESVVKRQREQAGGGPGR